MKKYVVNTFNYQFPKRVWSLNWLLIAGFVVCLSACKKTTDDVTPQLSTSSSASQSVDGWILDEMRYLYYWNDKIPANPDTTLAPDKFFSSILNTYNATTNPTGDRFSWIEDDGNTLKSELSGQSTTTGMNFTLYLRSSGSTDVIAQVLYVLPNSPAAKAGLKRGDIISKVAGTSLSTTNYSDLLFTGTTFTYGLASLSGQSLVDTDKTVTVTATVFQENPVFMDSVYTVGSKKVGYFVYNQFVTGPSGPDDHTYDNQVDAIFNNFKAQGVNELVLDLRYNPGGYTSSSANLASLIGKGISSSKLYFREEWNATITPLLLNDPQYGSSFFIQNFLDKSQNIGSNLSRVFVLTTDNTASASELIINGLRPYMTVTTIGTTTYGKNVGSITVTDDSGRFKWGMQPIVFKSFNSAGKSDYSTGFTPNIEVEEPINLLPLGDTKEALLSTALAQISGSASTRSGVTTNPLKPLRSSIQRKAGGQSMVKVLKTLKL
ncbi:S41 family peptidase [Spirosoma endophyticum]|uniref:C-terminal processing protease CtpA/Prc, contains a PDZ domain n=1 Tax=Spirosoma endophyticum TaxID=662367 RepID=A0A1I1GRL8_9BACT|nr:S41 family peptidase [Spirosoma endophyticum]SFC14294.1 C-terminal processing protease CtpA/Prc, contains a PDZ domain [Spirosoma endophyticum]